MIILLRYITLQGFCIEVHTSIITGVIEGPHQIHPEGLSRDIKTLIDEILVEILVNEYVVVCDGMRCRTLLGYFIGGGPPIIYC
jgi:hypothetical protein